MRRMQALNGHAGLEQVLPRAVQRPERQLEQAMICPATCTCHQLAVPAGVSNTSSITLPRAHLSGRTVVARSACNVCSNEMSYAEVARALCSNSGQHAMLARPCGGRLLTAGQSLYAERGYHNITRRFCPTVKVASAPSAGAFDLRTCSNRHKGMLEQSTTGESACRTPRRQLIIGS